jgi:uridylate kinase
MITVISLGGSIIVPDKVDELFLKEFVALIEAELEHNSSTKIILLCGGGAIARLYQQSYQRVANSIGEDEKGQLVNADWIGVMATRLNAELVRALFRQHCLQDVVIDPTTVDDFCGRILVAAGWKPGFSSDNDAVLLAKQFGAKTVINLSNIEQVMTADPKLDSQAKPLDEISWKTFRDMIGDVWIPGNNVPFDPVASKLAEECGIRVICAAGKNLPNLENIFRGKPFKGTVIGP